MLILLWPSLCRLTLNSNQRWHTSYATRESRSKSHNRRDSNYYASKIEFTVYKHIICFEFQWVIHANHFEWLICLFCSIIATIVSMPIQHLFIQYYEIVQAPSVYLFTFRIPLRVNTSISMAHFTESRTQTANKIFSRITESPNYKDKLFKRIQVNFGFVCKRSDRGL